MVSVLISVKIYDSIPKEVSSARSMPRPIPNAVAVAYGTTKRVPGKVPCHSFTSWPSVFFARIILGERSASLGLN
jgi:hypothetical protein